MKKNLVLFFAGLLLLSITGCSGALHDFAIDLNTPRDYVLTITGTGLSDGEHSDINSNIPWGGAKGTWSADGITYVSTALTITASGGTVKFFLKDYAPDGWVLEQAPSGNGVPLKISFGGGNEGWVFMSYMNGSEVAFDWADKK